MCGEMPLRSVRLSVFSERRMTRIGHAASGAGIRRHRCVGRGVGNAGIAAARHRRSRYVLPQSARVVGSETLYETRNIDRSSTETLRIATPLVDGSTHDL